MYRLAFTKQARKDAKKVASSNLKRKVKEIFKVLEEDPFDEYLAYERLSGELHGAYSRRINIQHRVVYDVLEDEKIVLVHRMWTHYE